MLISIIALAIILFMMILRDWLLYKNRGSATPDDQKNSPVITGSEDALSQLQIDRSTSSKEPN
jgi:hypothetical protein